MSEAFDNVDREKLFQHLETILLPEELHMTIKPRDEERISTMYFNQKLKAEK